MKIRFRKQKGKFPWVAEPLDLPGMPPIGQGKTKVHALASLFLHLIYESNVGEADWLTNANLQSLEFVK